MISHFQEAPVYCTSNKGRTKFTTLIRWFFSDTNYHFTSTLSLPHLYFTLSSSFSYQLTVNQAKISTHHWRMLTKLQNTVSSCRRVSAFCKFFLFTTIMRTWLENGCITLVILLFLSFASSVWVGSLSVANWRIFV